MTIESVVRARLQTRSAHFFTWRRKCLVETLQNLPDEELKQSLLSVLTSAPKTTTASNFTTRSCL